MRKHPNTHTQQSSLCSIPPVPSTLSRTSSTHTPLRLNRRFKLVLPEDRGKVGAGFRNQLQCGRLPVRLHPRLLPLLSDALPQRPLRGPYQRVEPRPHRVHTCHRPTGGHVSGSGGEVGGSVCVWDEGDVPPRMNTHPKMNIFLVYSGGCVAAYRRQVTISVFARTHAMYEHVCTCVCMSTRLQHGHFNAHKIQNP